MSAAIPGSHPAAGRRSRFYKLPSGGAVRPAAGPPQRPKKLLTEAAFVPIDEAPVLRLYLNLEQPLERLGDLPFLIALRAWG
jgi:hypothetical protein